MSDEKKSEDQGELAGGNYEIIRRRLMDHGRSLRTKADALNATRMETFGSTQMDVLANVRIRTENNCVPRDIASVGGRLLFGYNVFIGMKTETHVSDTFGVHELVGEGDQLELREVGISAGAPYLDEEAFKGAFRALYEYHQNAKLLQLRVVEGRVLAVFQTGSSARDVRVFHWVIDSQGQVIYQDDRGERHHTFPPSHDFNWRDTVREMHVHDGDHPHVSILDKVFVECVGGDLTVKVENNTASGEGIFSEPVDDPHQTLADASIQFAEIGSLILLRIRPYREEVWRHLIFNTLTQGVVRVDAIGVACVQLPEDHGIIFPGGFYLVSGDHKVFDGDVEGLEFKKVIRSPNGEDVLYIFHHREEGRYVLLPYNLIRKEVANPIIGHGYSLFDDGRMVVFRADDDEPSKVHLMQVWETPFVSDEFYASAPTDGSELSKIGNKDLVRGISEFLSVCRSIEEQRPTGQIYEDLIRQTQRTLDSFHWLSSPEVADFTQDLKAIQSTAELIIDEFEKVLSLRKQAATAITEASEIQEDLRTRLDPDHWKTVDDFVGTLGALRQQRGHLITLKEMRYIDLAAIDVLEGEIVGHFGEVSLAAVDFLLRPEALDPYHAEVDEITAKIDEVTKVTECEALRERLDEMSSGLDLLTEILAGLKIDDATARTAILEGISEVFGLLNRTKALLVNRRKELGSSEARAEFGAQFKLFGQSVTSGLGLSDSPEKCDDQLSRLMVQLEELESRFSEFDEYLEDLTIKREEVYEAFTQKKNSLQEDLQRRAHNLTKAADRILSGISRRASNMDDEDALNAYFASDAMVLKIRDIAENLRELGDTVKADDVEAKIKSARDQSLRQLRDKRDIFEDGEAVIKFGKHRFSVNTQALELTMLPTDDGMMLHLTGTEYSEAIEGDEELNATRGYWQQHLVSETPQVYRGEYLAASILFAAEEERDGFTITNLLDTTREEGDGLLKLVRAYASERYGEGYERGLHDADGTAILEKLLHLRQTSGLLRFAPGPRALACLWWSDESVREIHGVSLPTRARSLGALRAKLGRGTGLRALGAEIGELMSEFATCLGLEGFAAEAGSYLAEELVAERPRFTTSREAQDLHEVFRGAFYGELDGLSLPSKWQLVNAWLMALSEEDVPARPEAAALALTDGRLEREANSALTTVQIGDLLGQHPNIQSRTLTVRLDEFLPRLRHFRDVRVPGYENYRAVRHAVVERERARLRLSEYMPRVLTSFVRNKLISEVYLPILGDNFAKQMGALGDQKRTDLMGLLLLISPPGYGKTTLMEYVANRLGLVFMKINGPALGHSVTSLDPAEAGNATARQELQKLGLALEMGNNVMLYLDDIQHTHPEFLQKFISLCDAQRRIEGVWKERTKTYDLRGKKFCVVMAGNPYTESGDKFQIPDMLANRADVYNLGDILDGRDDVFALSYIENSLTSNSVLQPLATRPMEDVYKLVKLAQGEDVALSDLKHSYSNVEVGEITAVFKRMLACQKVLLRVNQEYIYSAGQDEAYRTEPKFQLQGSYRNMNKLAEKIVSAMNDDELEALIDDHYQGESQTLTTGAEHNLLKLAELRGRQTDEQRERWNAIRKEYQRRQSMGGEDDDPASRIAGQIAGLTQELTEMHGALSGTGMREELQALRASIDGKTIDLGPLNTEVAALRSSMEGHNIDLTPVATALQGLQQAVSTQQLDLSPLNNELQQINNALRTNAVAPYLEGIQASIAQAVTAAGNGVGAEQIASVMQTLDGIRASLDGLRDTQVEIHIENEPPEGLVAMLSQQVDIVEWTLVPLVRTMAQDLQGGREIWERLNEVLARLKQLDPSDLSPPSRKQPLFAGPASAAAKPSKARKRRKAPPKPRTAPSPAKPTAAKPSPARSKPSAAKAKAKARGKASVVVDPSLQDAPPTVDMPPISDDE
jgi:MoxR-like ATPase